MKENIKSTRPYKREIMVQFAEKSPERPSVNNVNKRRSRHAKYQKRNVGNGQIEYVAFCDIGQLLELEYDHYDHSVTEQTHYSDSYPNNGRD